MESRKAHMGDAFTFSTIHTIRSSTDSPLSTSRIPIPTGTPSTALGYRAIPFSNMFRIRDDDSVSSSDDDESEIIDLREDDVSRPPLIPRGISTFSDALKKINDLEQELRTLKQKLILAKDASKFHQARCSEIEQQLLSSTKCAQGGDAPQRQGANKHLGKVSGRCSTSNSSPKKKELPGITSRYTVPKLDASIMTADDILRYGLFYIGFGENRQRVAETKSVDCFKAHYGPEPRTVKDIMSDMCS